MDLETIAGITIGGSLLVGLVTEIYQTVNNPVHVQEGTVDEIKLTTIYGLYGTDDKDIAHFRLHSPFDSFKCDPQKISGVEVGDRVHVHYKRVGILLKRNYVVEVSPINPNTE